MTDSPNAWPYVGGRVSYSFPLMARYLAERSFKIDMARESGPLLFWYVQTFLWGRYAGSTETVLNKDLALIQPLEGALDRLIAGLRSDRGDLHVRAADFAGWSQGARFYPLLYMLTRTGQARDWGGGLELKAYMLGKNASLDVHHIFPKALLYRHGYERSEVNALANFTFLTKETNIQLSDDDPTGYLPPIEARFPGALATHWIPADPALWCVERYRDFLAVRRELLAQAANRFLEQLYGAPIPEPVRIVEPIGTPLLGGFADESEELELAEVNRWVVEQGLPSGELPHELVEAGTGRPLAMLDLAWPDGLQPGLSHPVAVLIGEGDAVHAAANQAGFRYFTSTDEFRRYVLAEVLGSEAAAA